MLSLQRSFAQLAFLKSLSQVLERHVGSRAYGPVKMPAHRCHLRLSQWLDCDLAWPTPSPTERYSWGFGSSDPGDLATCEIATDLELFPKMHGGKIGITPRRTPCEVLTKRRR